MLYTLSGGAGRARTRGERPIGFWAFTVIASLFAGTGLAQAIGLGASALSAYGLWTAIQQASS